MFRLYRPYFTIQYIHKRTLTTKLIYLRILTLMEIMIFIFIAKICFAWHDICWTNPLHPAIFSAIVHYTFKPLKLYYFICFMSFLIPSPFFAILLWYKCLNIHERISKFAGWHNVSTLSMWLSLCTSVPS